MGHIRLGDLPRSRKWIQVVALLDSDATTGQVAAATLDASKRGLEQASKDPGLVYSFWLLTQLPQFARRPDFAEQLRTIGLQVPHQPTVFDLLGAVTDSIDVHLGKTGGRTDLGEMAQMGLAESLAASLRKNTDGLFGSSPDDVQSELRRLSTSRNFSGLARDFFARLTERYLTYFLSRTVSKQFGSVSANREFREALSLHCKQASKIVEKFAGTWYSKTNYQGGITPRKAAGFVHVALKKLQAEFQKGAEVGQG